VKFDASLAVWHLSQLLSIQATAITAVSQKLSSVSQKLSSPVRTVRRQREECLSRHRLLERHRTLRVFA